MAGEFDDPFMPDEVLAAVIGAGPTTRSDSMAKLWAYINARGLLGPDRKTIHADETLARVYDGRTRLSMFDLTKGVMQHISFIRTAPPLADVLAEETASGRRFSSRELLERLGWESGGRQRDGPHRPSRSTSASARSA